MVPKAVDGSSSFREAAQAAPGRSRSSAPRPSPGEGPIGPGKLGGDLEIHGLGGLRESQGLALKGQTLVWQLPNGWVVDGIYAEVM